MEQRLLELGDNITVIMLIAVFSAPVYVVLSLPGIAICAIARSSLPDRCWARELIMSTLLVALFSPVLVPGHSPVILPLPFGLWLAVHMGNTQAAWSGLMWAAGIFLVTMLKSWRVWRREQIGAAARGLAERLWRRRRPTDTGSG